MWEKIQEILKIDLTNSKQMFIINADKKQEYNQ